MSSLFGKRPGRRIQVTLPPNWHDVSQFGRFLYSRTRDGRSGVLQVSLTGAKGASDRPNSSLDNLIQLLAQRSQAECTVRSLDNGRLTEDCWGQAWASAVCESPGVGHMQAWCISRGDDLLYATFISLHPTGADEVLEAQEIVFRLALK